MDVFYGTLDVKRFQYTYIVYIPKAWGIRSGDWVYVEYAPFGTEDWTKDLRKVYVRGTGTILALNKDIVQGVERIIIKLVKSEAPEMENESDVSA